MSDTLPKIDKGIQIPPAGRKTVYGFDRFEIGDSAFVEVSADTARAAASYYGSRNNKKFSVRIATEGDVKGVRVWRSA